MGNFNMLCPMHYPNKCNLPNTERKHLERQEKYKGFLMYQFKDNDSFLVDVIKEYFRNPEYYVFDSAVEPGTGIKICKICKLALASDFGIISLSPENLNVFTEIGFMFGLKKPCIMIYNKDKLKCKDADKLPFDINAFVNIEYSSRDGLLQGLQREMPHFISKLKSFTDAHRAIRDNIIKKLNVLPAESLIFLKRFVAEGKKEFTVSEFLKWQSNGLNQFSLYPNIEMFDDIHWAECKNKTPANTLIGKFLLERKEGGITKVVLEEGYRDFLQEYLWSDDFDELLKNKKIVRHDM